MTARVAILGCGNWGARVAERIHAMPGAELHALQDRNLAACEGLAHRFMVPWHARASAALEGATAAVIATPPASGRYEQVRACIDAGVTHIRIEKPVAIAHDEAALIAADFADRAHIVVGQTTLWNDAVPYLRGFVDGLWPEAFVKIRARRLSTVAPAHATTPFDDLAPHDLALLLDLFGYPRTASTDGRATRLEWCGARAEVQHVWDAPEKERTLTIEADGVMLTYDEIAGVVQVIRPDRGPSLSAFNPHGALDRELAAWLAGGGTWLQTGVDVVEVMDTARRSAQEAAA